MNIEFQMQKSSSLAPGECELIAAFICKMNKNIHSYEVYAETAKQFLEPEMVNAFLVDEDSEVLSRRLSCLMVVALHVLFSNKQELSESITQAKKYGASDQNICDTVAIATEFAGDSSIKK